MIRFLGLEHTFTSFSSFFHKEFWLHHYVIVIYCDLVMCFILQIFLIIWNHLRCVTVYRFFRILALPHQSHMVTDIPFVSWLLKCASCLEPLPHAGYRLDRIANRTPLFLLLTDYSPSHRPQSEPQQAEVVHWTPHSPLSWERPPNPAGPGSALSLPPQPEGRLGGRATEDEPGGGEWCLKMMMSIIQAPDVPANTQINICGKGSVPWSDMAWWRFL